MAKTKKSKIKQKVASFQRKMAKMHASGKLKSSTQKGNCDIKEPVHGLHVPLEKKKIIIEEFNRFYQ